MIKNIENNVLKNTVFQIIQNIQNVQIGIYNTNTVLVLFLSLNAKYFLHINNHTAKCPKFRLESLSCRTQVCILFVHCGKK